MSRPLVSLLDDDFTQRQVWEGLLVREGFDVDGHATTESLGAALRHGVPDVFLLHVSLDGAPGLPFVRRMRARHPRTPIVLIHGDGDAGELPEATRGGGFHHLPHPVREGRLLATLRSALEASSLALQVRRLERELAGSGIGGLIGRSPAMRDLFHRLDRIAPSEVTVLLRGERGTGKELVARALHADSGRRDGPMIVGDCEEIQDGVEAALFSGHGIGDLPGIVRRRRSLFRQADRGTLFLNGVEELSPPLQRGLLDVLRTPTAAPTGGEATVSVDVRLVAGTHRGLEEGVRSGAFPPELYSHLSVVEIRLPPLRERPEDIPLLAERVIRERSPRGSRPRLTRGALERLISYRWPGNLRELEAALGRALATCGREIDVSDLPAPIARGGAPATVEDGSVGPTATPPDTLDLSALERWAIERAVTVCDGNLTEAANRLGIGRTTLYRKLDLYGLR